MRRATLVDCVPIHLIEDFYPRSPCGERRCAPSANGAGPSISIHALLAESDTGKKKNTRKKQISIHALLAESDGGRGTGKTYGALFLSTLSLRRATKSTKFLVSRTGISIHALLAESDIPVKGICFNLQITFLSTLSLRRATVNELASVGGLIHFYPRSPCGERPPCQGPAL